MKKTIIFLGLNLFSNSILADVNSARIGFVSDNSTPIHATAHTIDREDFEDVRNLSWTMDNQSIPVGSSGWFQGNDTVFAAQSGSNTSYIAANFNNTAGTDICNWLIMPDLGYLQTLSFYSKTTTAATFPDRLLVLHSPTGTTNTGDCTNGFGDFTETLIEINPNLATNTYPEDWTQFTTNIDTTGRVAFVYYVEDIDNNGNYVGIDNVQWLPGLPVADLSLNTSTNINGDLQIGDSVTISHTLTNNGPQDASGATVDITLPTGLTYVSNTCSSVLNGTSLTWQVGDLANTASLNCQVTIEVSENGQQLYRAIVSAAEIDSNTNNNTNQFYINGPIAIIPTLNQRMLSLLSLVMLMIGLIYFRSNKINQ